MAPTASFTVATDAGAAVRSRINEVIAALQSSNAGATAPSSPTAGMLWLDTALAPPALKRRNATNTEWDVLLEASGNLAGLANSTVARANLGLGTMATKSAGVVTAPNFISSSDARLKSEVETIADALALVSALRGVRFTMDGSRQVGVIAQEVETILPEVVCHVEVGQLSVAYGNITGLLIEAVKELTARVAALEEARL